MNKCEFCDQTYDGTMTDMLYVHANHLEDVHHLPVERTWEGDMLIKIEVHIR